MTSRLPRRLGDRDPSRADWMELFFDLVFVALVGQLAHGLHEHPGFPAIGVFLVLFAAVWWSWGNLTFVVNVSTQLTRRGLSVVMLAAMFAVGAMAVAAPEAIGERAWLFAAGNAAIRIVLLAVWVRLSWRDGVGARIRLASYNGVTALLWLVSIWLPSPVDYVLWAAAIALEVILLVTTASPGVGAICEMVDSGLPAGSTDTVRVPSSPSRYWLYSASSPSWPMMPPAPASDVSSCLSALLMLLRLLLADRDLSLSVFFSLTCRISR